MYFGIFIVLVCRINHISIVWCRRLGSYLFTWELRGPIRRMLHNVIILVPTFRFLFFTKLATDHSKNIFSIFYSPGRELWHWHQGWGWGWGTKHRQKTQKTSPQNISYEKCLHFWDIFRKMLKNIIKLCSYIQKKTLNTIHAFKITIYNTKHTNNIKIHVKNNQHFRTFPTISKIHISNK